MINYGDAINWCIQNSAVFRFTDRRERSEFIFTNESIPGDKALELAVTIEGKTYVAHSPLDSSAEPSKAVAVSLIVCVEHFLKRESITFAGVAN